MLKFRTWLFPSSSIHSSWVKMSLAPLKKSASGPRASRSRRSCLRPCPWSGCFQARARRLPGVRHSGLYPGTQDPGLSLFCRHVWFPPMHRHRRTLAILEGLSRPAASRYKSHQYQKVNLYQGRKLWKSVAKRFSFSRQPVSR